MTCSFFFLFFLIVLHNSRWNRSAASDTVDLPRTSLMASLTGPSARAQSETKVVSEHLSFKQQTILFFLRNQLRALSIF